MHPRFLGVPFPLPETSEASLGEKGPTEGVCVLHVCSWSVANDQLHIVVCAKPPQLPNRCPDEWVASPSRICCANCSRIVRKEQHHLSSPRLNPSSGSHQQIEALNRRDADLPKSLWAEAASTACYVYNRLPNAHLKCKSPYEVWYSRKPDLSNLRVFGCVAYALVPAAKRKKFDNRTEKMRFLGYHKGHRGYKLMEKGSNRVFY